MSWNRKTSLESSDPSSSSFGAYFLTAVFFGVVGWAVYEMFIPKPTETIRVRPTLRPAIAAPDMRLLYERVRETPPAPSRSSWAAPRLRPDWKWIVVHHSATAGGNARIFDRYHRSQRGKKGPMENGMAYHFVIGNGVKSPDGKVEVGRRWTEQLQGGHLSGDALNDVSIGICLVGNFEHTLPTEKQIASLKSLINYLLAITSLDATRVRGHEAIPEQSTICPGRYLPVGELVKYRFGVRR